MREKDNNKLHLHWGFPFRGASGYLEHILPMGRWILAQAQLPLDPTRELFEIDLKPTEKGTWVCFSFSGPIL